MNRELKNRTNRKLEELTEKLDQSYSARTKKRKKISSMHGKQKMQQMEEKIVLDLQIYEQSYVEEQRSNYERQIDTLKEALQNEEIKLRQKLLEITHKNIEDYIAFEYTPKLLNMVDEHINSTKENLLPSNNVSWFAERPTPTSKARETIQTEKNRIGYNHKQAYQKQT